MSGLSTNSSVFIPEVESTLIITMLSAPLPPDMSRLEVALDSIIQLFKEYSAKEGVKGQLSAGEFKDLLEKELTHPKLKDKFRLDEVNDLLKSLDEKKDEQLNFREFCGFITELGRTYYKAQKEDKSTAQK
ncbi:hypothetical protein GJAV_G00007630 [Gymnothorax javanicus]|nr:hypothetical protein GJAV_G00007630 [Gymnothorax javanicus]